MRPLRLLCGRKQHLLLRFVWLFCGWQVFTCVKKTRANGGFFLTHAVRCEALKTLPQWSLSMLAHRRSAPSGFSGSSNSSP